MTELKDVNFVSVADAVRMALMVFHEVLDVQVNGGQRTVRIKVFVADNARCVQPNDYRMAIISVLPIQFKYRMVVVYE